MIKRFSLLFFIILLLGAGCTENRSVPAAESEVSTPVSVSEGTSDSVPASASTSVPTAAGEYLTFSLNMQDFSYPDKSVDVLRKALDLHEKYQVPVDVFLTGTIAKYYAEHAPDLIERLKSSPMVAVSYHVRPPAPYTNDFDWLGLGSMSAAEQYSTVMNYETHDIDLVNGTPTNETGGYQYVKDLVGYAPYAAGVPSGAGLTSAVDNVMVDLGAVMDVVHGDKAFNLGEKKNGLFIRPETIDLKLFSYSGASGASALDEGLAAAPKAPGAQAPYFVNVKMHDNDFFAEDSAWTTVYLAKGSHRRPPFDVTLKSALLSSEAQSAMWTRYEEAVKHASELNNVGLLNISQTLKLE